MGWLCGVGVFRLIECSHPLPTFHCRLIFNNNIIIIRTYLQSSLNQDISLLSTRMTFVGTKFATSRYNCSFRSQHGVSANPKIHLCRSRTEPQTSLQLTQCFIQTSLQTRKFGTACIIEMTDKSDE